MVNVQLLEQTMRHIIDHPETHDQGIWVSDKEDCGTTACFAGWACLLSGAKQYDVTLSQSTFSADTASGWIRADDLAVQLLGIDEDTATNLFDGDNTVDDLQRIVKQLVNREHTPEGAPT
jgi:hypothetical protein